jgi:hypothetical protein
VVSNGWRGKGKIDLDIVKKVMKYGKEKTCQGLMECTPRTLLSGLNKIK